MMLLMFLDVGVEVLVKSKDGNNVIGLAGTEEPPTPDVEEHEQEAQSKMQDKQQQDEGDKGKHKDQGTAGKESGTDEGARPDK